MASNLGQVDQPTRFVGRETELDETEQLLDSADCRLLTLIGVGGVGKTRLALQLAKRREDDFLHGVVFVNLQPIPSGKQIVSAVVDAVGIVLSGHDTPENQLLQYLHDKELLLLLDNFEHVLDGVTLVSRIIQQAPGVKLLVTSREALSLPEEWLYPVEGLPSPLSHQTEDLETVTAVALFVERARQVYPAFSLADNRASVVRICQLVDGLPLALEIAASWTRTLSCPEIVAEIQQNLNFLISNLRHVPERHRSMQAVFTQTWERLSESEQTLFKRMAVFSGSFRREAAEAIAGASLPLLSSLLDKCLLRRQAGGRYQIHELLRQYAAGKLEDSEMERLAEAHCRYYCGYLAQRKAGLIEQEQVQSCLEIEEELENIRAAWHYGITHQLTDALGQAMAPFFYFCQMQSQYLEYVEASELAVDLFRQVEATSDLAQVLVYQGWMLIRIGRFEQAAAGLVHSQTLFEEYQLMPDYGMGSHPLAPLIVLYVIQGDYTRAIALGQQLKRISAERVDNENLGFACYGLASAHLNLGQYEAALENAAETVRLFTEIGNHWMSAYGHIELGNVHRAMGHYAEAERQYRASLRIRQEYKDPEGVAVAGIRLGEVSMLQQDYETARQLYEQSLALYQKLNDLGGLAAAHHGLGQLAELAGVPGLAAHHFRAALDIAGKINFVPLLLSLLIDIGALMLTHNAPSRGIELLQLSHDHPAGNQEQKRKASDLLVKAGSTRNTPVPELKPTIAALQVELLHYVPTSAAARSSGLVEPLTERELEVLHLMVRGLSNPAIAERLVVSVGTVKSHTSRIYGKLGVTNRVEAVTKAQELSLFR